MTNQDLYGDALNVQSLGNSQSMAPILKKILPRPADIDAHLMRKTRMTADSLAFSVQYDVTVHTISLGTNAGYQLIDSLAVCFQVRLGFDQPPNPAACTQVAQYAAVERRICPFNPTLDSRIDRLHDLQIVELVIRLVPGTTAYATAILILVEDPVLRRLADITLRVVGVVNNASRADPVHLIRVGLIRRALSVQLRSCLTFHQCNTMVDPYRSATPGHVFELVPDSSLQLAECCQKISPMSRPVARLSCRKMIWL
jgi:hypothetical protein